MIPELGHFALILAMLLAFLQALFGIAGPALNRDRWVKATMSAVAGQFVMIATAVGCLVWSFVDFDFSVRYVAENSNSALPLFYRITALWGAHEGSLLLWILLIAAWTLAVALLTTKLPRRFSARVLGVLGFISFSFLLYTLITSNPFVRLEPPALDGIDLNPLLQDPGLASHPPVLYTGYVGLSVAFAFACAAMLEGRMDAAWARWTRPWTIAAWAFLTCGITLGSWWSYYTLGWGGYWAWDPVENASFMPWLVATALIHSLAVTDKRGLFKSWTLLLAILGFSLSLIGTFLVRSGVLVSVHSFAASPARGSAILILLCVAIGSALALYAWRAPTLKSTGGFELTSRESFLLFNNILLVIAAATIFAGTIAPLIATAVGQGVLSVGPPYFRPTFLVSILPLLALLSIGIHANWKRGRLGENRLRLLATLGLACAIALGIVVGIYSGRHFLAVVGLALGIWIILSSLVDPIDRLRRRLSLSRGVLGMSLAHVGLGVAVIALSVVGPYTVEHDIALKDGQSAQIGNYVFRLIGTRDVDGPNYSATRAEVVVSRNGRIVTTLFPEKRLYWVRQQPGTHAGIKNEYGTDLFVSLGSDLGDGRWSMRAQVRPMITLLWLGPMIMALGGFCALTDKRYRLARESAREPLAVGVRS